MRAILADQCSGSDCNFTKPSSCGPGYKVCFLLFVAGSEVILDFELSLNLNLGEKIENNSFKQIFFLSFFLGDIEVENEKIAFLVLLLLLTAGWSAISSLECLQNQRNKIYKNLRSETMKELCGWKRKYAERLRCPSNGSRPLLDGWELLF